MTCRCVLSVPLFVLVLSVTDGFGHPCVDSHECHRFGKCSDVDGRCQATEDEHCAQSDICREAGGCALVNARCIPTKDEHCAQSDACERWGPCSNVGRRWTVIKDEHCAQATRCTEYGACSNVDGQCRATEDQSKDRGAGLRHYMGRHIRDAKTAGRLEGTFGQGAGETHISPLE